MTFAAPAPPARPAYLRAGPAGASSLLPWALAALAVFALYVPHSFRIGPVEDVAWLLVVARRVVDGAVLNRDVFEINPPLIVWLNTVPVRVADATGLSLVHSLRLCILALGAGAFLALGAVLRRMAELPEAVRGALLLAAVFATTFGVGGMAGQREHIALLLVLPWLAAAGATLNGTELPVRLRVGTAVAGAVGLAIKPYFLPVAVGVEVLALLRFRMGTFRRPEPWAMGGVFAGYLLLALAVEPDSFGPALEYARAVYQSGWGTTAGDAVRPQFLVVSLAALAALALPRWRGRVLRAHPVFGTLAVGAAGFALAYWWQLKGWPNHLYPFSALSAVALFAGGIALWRRPGADAAFNRIAAVALVALSAWLVMPFTRAPAVQPTSLATADVVERAGGAGSVLILSGTLSEAFPYVVDSGVEWASRMPCAYLTYGLQTLEAGGLATGARGRIAREGAAFSARVLGEDLAAFRPELVVLGRADGEAILGDLLDDPVFSAEWGRYREVPVEGRTVYRRLEAEEAAGAGG